MDTAIAHTIPFLYDHKIDDDPIYDNKSKADQFAKKFCHGDRDISANSLGYATLHACNSIFEHENIPSQPTNPFNHVIDNEMAHSVRNPKLNRIIPKSYEALNGPITDAIYRHAASRIKKMCNHGPGL
eukprot:85037_1